MHIVNLGTIELHTFLGSLPRLERPDAILFDIDPEPPASTADAARVALLLRDRLQRDALVKTSGGLGLHVLVPLRRTVIAPHSLRAADVPLASVPVTWEEVRDGDDLRFGPQQALERVQRLGDLWQRALDARARLRAFGHRRPG